MFNFFKSKTQKVVKNKSGSTSSFTKVKSNGKSKWVKTGGSNWKGSSSKKRKK